MDIRNKIQKIFNSLIDILFPIECLGCNQEDVFLCDNCLKSIPLHQSIIPFEHPLQYLDQVLTAVDYRHRLVRKSIHYFKFRFIVELAKPLAKLLIEYVKRINLNLNDALIIPVPLNKKRLLERGFNQSELIARYFADGFNLPLAIEAIVRCRHTPHQVGLNKKQRKNNMENAFQILNPELIKNKNIILIDDVVTTGSTLEEIAKVLKENGAKKVIGLTIAKD